MISKMASVFFLPEKISFNTLVVNAFEEYLFYISTTLKSTTAYYLMLLYLSVMFKPLIPIITDAWEHEFNEIEHLSLVHEKYGSHHVEKELADNSHDDDHDKNPNTLKSEDQVPIHVLADEYKNTSISEAFDKHFALLTYSILLFIFIAWEGPPPKFI